MTAIAKWHKSRIEWHQWRPQAFYIWPAPSIKIVRMPYKPPYRVYRIEVEMAVFWLRAIWKFSIGKPPIPLTYEETLEALRKDEK